MSFNKVLLGLLLSTVSASAAMAAPTCKSLQDRYVDANKELSAIYAESIGETSAPRLTIRKLESLNVRAQQSMTLDMIIKSNCALPDQASETIYYMIDAITCATDRMTTPVKDLPAATCDRSKWAPVIDKALQSENKE